MSNTFLTPTIIAREALTLLKSNFVVTKLFSRRYEADLNPGLKRGDTITIRRRSTGVVDEYNGSTITVRDIKESPITLTLEKHFDASIKVSSKEMTLDIVDFSEQVLAPRMLEMAEKVDTYGLEKLKDLPNAAGNSSSAPDSLPDSIADMALVEKSLNDLKVPVAPRFQIASTEYKATLLSVDSFVEVDKSGADNALRMAEIGPLMGLRTFMAQNTPTTTHTSGTQTSMVVDGALVAGATSIVYDGAGVADGTLKVGDIVNITGYGGVVVAADAAAVSSAGTFTIKEPLREAVADGIAMTVYDGGGNTRQCHGAAFHPDAFAFVSAPLVLPKGAKGSGYAMDSETGLQIRAVYDWDRDLKSDVLSLDILVGAKMVDGRLGAQIIKNIT